MAINNEECHSCDGTGGYWLSGRGGFGANSSDGWYPCAKCDGTGMKAKPEFKLTISGSVRSKKNSKIPINVRGRFMLIPSKAYQKWEKAGRREVFAQLPKGFRLITGAIKITATFYYKGNRPDLSGASESVGDYLEGVVYSNDRLIESWDGSRLYHDKEDPRTEIIIREL